MIRVIEGDWRTEIDGDYHMIFADPPDNIGLKYDGYKDKNLEYHRLLEQTVLACHHCDTMWISFNPNHMSLMGSIIHELQQTILLHDYRVRWFVQSVTFGYYMPKDFGRCFRPMIRIMHEDAPSYPDAVRVESERQRMGDKRANPNGKIPGDCWTINRVTGNSKQRRAWHPTQIHEDLYRRCLDFSTKPGDRVADLYAGTGTLARAATDRDVDLYEISPDYCDHLRGEFL